MAGKKDAILAKMKRTHPQEDTALKERLSAGSDWYGTCRKCGTVLVNMTLKQMQEHKCNG